MRTIARTRRASYLVRHASLPTIQAKNSAYALNKQLDCFAFARNDTYAFTLAEVLITLGIIGVVAAMTMPSLIANYQDNVRKQQFKKAYNILNNTLRKTVSDFGYEPECYAYMYDSDRPCKAVCAGKNEYGTCNSYTCADGSPLPSNENGLYNECSVFKPNFLKNLSIVKSCASNGVTNGCMPAYNGSDNISKENDPDSNPDPGLFMSTSSFRKRPAYVLADGMILIDIQGNGWMGYAVDINGMKKPNKWGHDLFAFGLVGSKKSGSTFSSFRSQGLVEKGGKSTEQMINEIYK